MQTRQITQEVIKDWAEHPVSKELLKNLRRELDLLYQARAEIVVWNNAVEEQARRVFIAGEEKRIADFISLLRFDETDGTISAYFPEEEEELDE